MKSDRYRDHDDHVDETRADEVCREHSVPFPRVLQHTVQNIHFVFFCKIFDEHERENDEREITRSLVYLVKQPNFTENCCPAKSKFWKLFKGKI